jgi:alcohol dehydrogenase
VAPGGTIANIGVHGTKVDLHLERLWSHNIAITTRLVDTTTTPTLLKTVQSKKIEPKLLSHTGSSWIRSWKPTKRSATRPGQRP